MSWRLNVARPSKGIFRMQLPYCSLSMPSVETTPLVLRLLPELWKGVDVAIALMVAPRSKNSVSIVQRHIAFQVHSLAHCLFTLQSRKSSLIGSGLDAVDRPAHVPFFVPEPGFVRPTGCKAYDNATFRAVIMDTNMAKLYNSGQLFFIIPHWFISPLDIDCYEDDMCLSRSWITRSIASKP